MANATSRSPDGRPGRLAEMHSALDAAQPSRELVDLRHDHARLVYGLTADTAIAVTMSTIGGLDYIAPEIAADQLAVAKAAVTNVVQHARAGSLAVTITVDPSSVLLRLADDGCGLGTSVAGPAMTDMTKRAERRGGSCTWKPNLPTGTIVDWRVPQ